LSNFVALTANLVKAKDAKLWALQVMLMVARLPKTADFVVERRYFVF